MIIYQKVRVRGPAVPDDGVWLGHGHPPDRRQQTAHALGDLIIAHLVRHPRERIEYYLYVVRIIFDDVSVLGALGPHEHKEHLVLAGGGGEARAVLVPLLGQPRARQLSRTPG